MFKRTKLCTLPLQIKQKSLNMKLTHKQLLAVQTLSYMPYMSMHTNSLSNLNLLPGPQLG